MPEQKSPEQKSTVFTSRRYSLRDTGMLLTIESLAGIHRLCFLDIDGVLNADGTPGPWGGRVGATKHRYVTSGGHRVVGISPALVERLNRLVLTFPDMRFVLSSTWREEYSDTLHYLAHQGFRGRVIGMTTESDVGYDGKPLARATTRIRRASRGAEIADWVARYEYTGEYVSLDDDEDAGSLGRHWVRTNPDTGITEADIDLAAWMLL